MRIEALHELMEFGKDYTRGMMVRSPRLDVVKKALRILAGPDGGFGRRIGKRPKILRNSPYGNRSYYDARDHEINIWKPSKGKKPRPPGDAIGEALHEAGHGRRNWRGRLRRPKFLQANMDSISRTGKSGRRARKRVMKEEVKANKHAVEALERAGATPSYVRRYKDMSNVAMRTYRKGMFDTERWIMARNKAGKGRKRLSFKDNKAIRKKKYREKKPLWQEHKPTLNEAKQILRDNPYLRKKNVDLEALHELIELCITRSTYTYRNKESIKV